MTGKERVLLSAGVMVLILLTSAMAGCTSDEDEPDDHGTAERPAVGSLIIVDEGTAHFVFTITQNKQGDAELPHYLWADYELTVNGTPATTAWEDTAPGEDAVFVLHMTPENMLMAGHEYEVVITSIADGEEVWSKTVVARALGEGDVDEEDEGGHGDDGDGEGGEDGGDGADGDGTDGGGGTGGGDENETGGGGGDENETGGGGGDENETGGGGGDENETGGGSGEGPETVDDLEVSVSLYVKSQDYAWLEITNWGNDTVYWPNFLVYVNGSYRKSPEESAETSETGEFDIYTNAKKELVVGEKYLVTIAVNHTEETLWQDQVTAKANPSGSSTTANVAVTLGVINSTRAVMVLTNMGHDPIEWEHFQVRLNGSVLTTWSEKTYNHDSAWFVIMTSQGSALQQGGGYEIIVTHIESGDGFSNDVVAEGWTWFLKADVDDCNAARTTLYLENRGGDTVVWSSLTVKMNGTEVEASNSLTPLGETAEFVWNHGLGNQPAEGEPLSVEVADKATGKVLWSHEVWAQCHREDVPVGFLDLEPSLVFHNKTHANLTLSNEGDENITWTGLKVVVNGTVASDGPSQTPAGQSADFAVITKVNEGFVQGESVIVRVIDVASSEIIYEGRVDPMRSVG